MILNIILYINFRMVENSGGDYLKFASDPEIKKLIRDGKLRITF